MVNILSLTHSEAGSIPAGSTLKNLAIAGFFSVLLTRRGWRCMIVVLGELDNLEMISANGGHKEMSDENL